MTFSPAFQLSYRDILAAVLIMLLAFGLRVIVTFDRASRDQAFDPLPLGTDQHEYVRLAEEYEAKQWPTEPFYWQPGVTYFLVGVRGLIGQSIGQMTLGMALVNALGCGFMVGVGWMLTRRRWGGYWAGLLVAVFPTAIFYSTTLLTESLAAVYVILVLFVGLWQREKRAWWRSGLLGLLFGLLAITRTNLAGLVAAWLLLLWMDTCSDGAKQQASNVISRLISRDFVIHCLVMLGVMSLMIAPVTLWNRQTSIDGNFALVTDTGMIEMYRGNNRDSDGMRTNNVALEVTKGDYLKAALEDARRDPIHFIELQLRKSGLYWSALEPGNNVDFAENGTAVSALLRAIPLNFVMLAALGWLGVFALLQNERRVGIFFVAVHVIIFGGVLVIWVASRSKFPAIAPLAATSAYLVIPISDAIKAYQERRIVISSAVKRYAIWIGVILLVLAGLTWAAYNLPQQRPVSALPDDVRRLDVVFDDKIKLVGWKPLPEWPAAQVGWTHFLRSYVIQLYWQLVEPTSEDYSAYIAFVGNEGRLAGIDRPIGSVSFRTRLTSEWQAGETYAEIVGFYLPQDLPLEQDGDIRLGLYKTRGEPGDPNRTIEPVGATSLAEQPESIVLQRLGVFDTGYIGQELNGFVPSDAVFGNAIALKGYKLPEKLVPGEVLSIGLYWKALQVISRNYTVFVHVEDEAGKIVAQFDSPPRNNTLVTSTWPPDYPIEDEIHLKMPDRAGQYHLFIGLYDTDQPSHDRLPAPTEEGRWPLATITVSN